MKGQKCMKGSERGREENRKERETERKIEKREKRGSERRQNYSLRMSDQNNIKAYREMRSRVKG